MDSKCILKKGVLVIYNIKEAKGKSNVQMHMQIALLYRFTTYNIVFTKQY